MHPQCRHIAAFWDLLEWFHLFVKNMTKLGWFQLFGTSPQVKIQFQTFLKKYQILGFPWCSTREDLSIDVSITIVGLILTKPRWFQLIVTSRNSNFELFWKKYKNLGFPCFSIRQDLSIDVSITIVGLILTKLGWFQLFSTSQNSISNFFFLNSNFWVSML